MKKFPSLLGYLLSLCCLSPLRPSELSDSICEQQSSIHQLTRARNCILRADDCFKEATVPLATEQDAWQALTQLKRALPGLEAMQGLSCQETAQLKLSQQAVAQEIADTRRWCKLGKVPTGPNTGLQRPLQAEEKEFLQLRQLPLENEKAQIAFAIAKEQAKQKPLAALAAACQHCLASADIQDQFSFFAMRLTIRFGHEPFLLEKKGTLKALNSLFNSALLENWEAYAQQALQLLDQQIARKERLRYQAQECAKEEAVRATFRRSADSKDRQQSALIANLLQTKRLLQKQQALLDFFQRISSAEPCLPEEKEPTLAQLNRQDAYHKACLALMQEAYCTAQQLAMLTHQQEIIQKHEFPWTTKQIIAAVLGGLLGSFLVLWIVDALEPKELIAEQLLHFQSSYYYLEELSEEFAHTFGADYALTQALQQQAAATHRQIQELKEDKSRLHKELAQKAEQEYKQALKHQLSASAAKSKTAALIKQRSAFLKCYQQQLADHLAHYRQMLDYYIGKLSYIEGYVEQEQDEEFLADRGAMQMVDTVIERLTLLHNTAAIELLVLPLQQQMLGEELPDFYAPTLLRGGDGALNRRQLQEAIQMLGSGADAQRLAQQASQFQAKLTSLQNQAQHLIVAKTPALQKLLQTHCNVVLCSLDACSLEMDCLQLRLDDLQAILNRRRALAQAFGLGARLIARYRMQLMVVNSTSGPIGLLISAGIGGLATCTGKAIEDLVLNGGDLSGWSDDFLSIDTLQQGLTSAVGSAASQATVRLIPLAGQKMLCPETYEKVCNFYKAMDEGDISSLSPRALGARYARNFATAFAGNVSSIVVGKGIGYMLELAQEATTDRQAAAVLSHNPQDPHYLPSHQDEGWLKLLAHGSLDALVMGATTSFTELLGKWYLNHKGTHGGNPTYVGYTLHKATHGAIGGATGLLQKCIQGHHSYEELIAGLKAGATGAIVGEVISEAYLEHIILPFMEKELEDEQPLTQEEFLARYEPYLQEAALAGKLVSIGTAYVLAQDIEIAYRSADQAVEHNFIVTSISIGLTLWNIYNAACVLQQAYKIYEEKGWKAASKHLGKEAATQLILNLIAAGGIKLLGKMLGKAPGAVRFLRQLKASQKQVAKAVAQAEKKAFKKGVSRAARQVKFYDKKELARRLGTDVNTFHRSTKKRLKEFFTSELKQLNCYNPDIGVDNLGNVVLKNPKSGKTLFTKEALNAFKS